jgi:hypothetical protein
MASRQATHPLKTNIARTTRQIITRMVFQVVKHTRNQQMQTLGLAYISTQKMEAMWFSETF